MKCGTQGRAQASEWASGAGACRANCRQLKARQRGSKLQRRQGRGMMSYKGGQGNVRCNQEANSAKALKTKINKYLMTPTSKIMQINSRETKNNIR
jgi:hypothetical protein